MHDHTKIQSRDATGMHLGGVKMALAVAFMCFVSVPAAAQHTIVVKKDETRVEGKIVEEDFEYIVIETADGQQVKIVADDIQDILYPDPEREGGGNLEGAGGAAAGAAGAGNKGELEHEKEWPREPANDLEKKVWALGPRIRWSGFADAAKELAAIQDEGKIALFEELLAFDYTLVTEEQDELATLWRTTLADCLGATGEEKYEDLAHEMAVADDKRKRHDAIVILCHFPTEKNAEIIADIFASGVEPIPESMRPHLGDILIANEEAFNEALDDVDAAYTEQPGLPGAAERALKALGKIGLDGVAKSFRGLKGEEKRAMLYLIARLTEITNDDRKLYGYSDDDVEEIKLSAAKIVVPALGRDDDFLVDIFFAIVKIGETTYAPLIAAMKSQEQKRWAGVAMRRMTGTSLPTNYDRWAEWYRLKYGK